MLPIPGPPCCSYLFTGGTDRAWQQSSCGRATAACRASTGRDAPHKRPWYRRSQRLMSCSGNPKARVNNMQKCSFSTLFDKSMPFLSTLICGFKM